MTDAEWFKMLKQEINNKLLNPKERRVLSHRELEKCFGSFE